MGRRDGGGGGGAAGEFRGEKITVFSRIYRPRSARRARFSRSRARAAAVIPASSVSSVLQDVSRQGPWAGAKCRRRISGGRAARHGALALGPRAMLARSNGSAIRRAAAQFRSVGDALAYSGMIGVLFHNRHPPRLDRVRDVRARHRVYRHAHQQAMWATCGLPAGVEVAGLLSAGSARPWTLPPACSANTKGEAPTSASQDRFTIKAILHAVLDLPLVLA